MNFEHTHEAGLTIRRLPGRDPAGTIVWIHGLGESGLCFEEVVVDPRLGRWTHLVPDLAGYGRSPWSSAPLDLEGHADQLNRWIERHVGGRVVLVGHSMGGVLGMLMTERRPDLFSGLINVEGNVSPEDCTYSSQAAGQTAEQFIGAGRWQLLEAVYRGGADNRALRGYYPSLRLCDPRAFHLNSQELVALSSTETLGARYAGVAPPQIYILGDPLGTGSRSRALLDAAGIKIRVIEDAGHWPFIDHPEAFVEAMLEFLPSAVQ